VQYEIPAPDIGRVESIGSNLSALEAAEEYKGFFEGRKSKLRHDTWEWRLKVWFKVFLFVFIMVVNGWWAWSVLNIVKQSAIEGSKFHVANSVLVSLVSTSIANFLALVVIVARHLFPSQEQKDS
jgi:hypothetical protein